MQPTSWYSRFANATPHFAPGHGVTLNLAGLAAVEHAQQGARGDLLEDVELV